MRSIGFLSAFLAAGLSLFGQQYNINTVAGGSPLPNVPFASLAGAPIGNPSVLTTDASGNIYFISDDCVFSITSNGMTRVAGNSRVGYAGDGGAATQAEFYAPQGLAIDSSNNLYIADTGNNRIRKVVLATGIITTIAGTGIPGYSGDGSQAASAAVYVPQGLAVDSSGNLYIADTGNNAIREITAATGNITTVAGNGTGTAGTSGDGQPATGATALLNAPTGVAVDSSGNIYIAESKSNRIRKVTSNILITIVGNGVAGFSGDGNSATAAELNLPTQVNVAPSGVIYILDSGNARVREILPNNVIVTVAGVGGTVPVTNPQGIASDFNSNLFISDTTHVILKLTPSSSFLDVAGPSAVSYYLGDGGPAASAQLVQPEGLALDSGNNVYVADAGESRVRKFLAGGTISSPLDGNVVGPAGVAIDSSGNLYIADATGNVVVKVTPAGASTLIAGTGTRGSLGDNQLATSVQLNQPSGVAVDASGNVYIADTGNNKIRKVTIATGFINTLAGNGSAGFLDNVVASAGLLNQPTGLVLDSAGDIFIADTGNNRIRKIAAATGLITTVAGNGGNTSSGDGGLATAASIASPHGVAVDSIGNLYITDSSARVRKVSVLDLITTIAGNGMQAYSGDGGPATSAELDTPWGVAVDPAGNVYVSDPGEQAVRILTPVAASPLSILTTSPLTSGTVGTPYAQSLTASGGTPPYSWSIAFGSLPPGLTLSSSGSITGTPTVNGSFLITFLVTDSASVTAQATIGIPINPSTPTGLTITTPPVLVSGGVGLPYSQTLTAVSGNPPYTWSLVSGALPPNVGLSPSGLISGAPQSAGNYTFTVRVNDTFNAIANQTFTLVVYSFATPARTGVLAHFAAGGPWTTRGYLTNISSSPIEVNLVIHTDDGSFLPISVTQQSSTQTNSSNLFVGVMNPNTTLVINTGTGLTNTETGWIDVLTSGSTTNPLQGFAVFRLTSNGSVSEGTTPLQTSFESKMDLQFDDTTGYDANVAIANLTNSAATVTATVLDSNGNQLGTYSLSLGANGHTAFVVPMQFGVTANQIGLIQFVSSAGNLAGVGLRASTTAGTFTTVPVIQP